MIHIRDAANKEPRGVTDTMWGPFYSAYVLWRTEVMSSPHPISPNCTLFLNLGLKGTSRSHKFKPSTSQLRPSACKHGGLLYDRPAILQTAIELRASFSVDTTQT